MLPTSRVGLHILANACYIFSTAFDSERRQTAEVTFRYNPRIGSSC